MGLYAQCSTILPYKRYLTCSGAHSRGGERAATKGLPGGWDRTTGRHPHGYMGSRQHLFTGGTGHARYRPAGGAGRPTRPPPPCPFRPWGTHPCPGSKVAGSCHGPPHTQSVPHPHPGHSDKPARGGGCCIHCFGPQGPADLVAEAAELRPSIPPQISSAGRYTWCGRLVLSRGCEKTPTTRCPGHKGSGDGGAAVAPCTKGPLLAATPTTTGWTALPPSGAAGSRPVLARRPQQGLEAGWHQAAARGAAAWHRVSKRVEGPFPLYMVAHYILCPLCSSVR